MKKKLIAAIGILEYELLEIYIIHIFFVALLMWSEAFTLLSGDGGLNPDNATVSCGWESKNWL